MGSYQTAEEVKQEHLEKFGPELGSIFHRLHNEIVFLHIKWCEFEELYSHKDRVELMNDISPNFFFYLQNLLLEDVVLGITRISENKEFNGKTNLTIRLFPDLVNVSIKGDAGKLIKRIYKESSFCRDRRNRKIGHLDRELALDDKAEPLEKTNRNKVNKVLDSLAELMNLIQKHYMNSSTYYRIDSNHGYGLLLQAQDGVRFQNLRFKFLKGEKIEYSDFERKLR
jgi:hypothetical protein